jgi:shikimate kinase
VKNNIILIGFMGVGKGTIARALVKEAGYFAIDTDDLIESMENRSIKKIFASDGEPYFRALEQKTADWIERSVDNTLISVGGGFFKVSNLKRLGKVFYLNSSFEGILDRILSSENAEKKLKKRPLFKTPESARELYNSRVELYHSVADFIIDVERRDTQEIVDEILSYGRGI